MKKKKKDVKLKKEKEEKDVKLKKEKKILKSVKKGDKGRKQDRERKK